MIRFLVVLLGMLAALLEAADTNFAGRTSRSGAPPDPKDPVEQEFRQLMERDDAAHAEVDRWIRDDEEFAAKGAGTPPAQLKRRILNRLEPIGEAYEDFLKRHPDFVRARIAYASFVGDLRGEGAAQEQLEKALAIETNNPAIYNNLAVIYAHKGPIKRAFEYYDRAIELSPREPTYYHSLGTAVFLFRAEAGEYYQLDQKQVFAKALALYSNATRLAPMDFPLAVDVAQTYYGIEPLRTEEALRAWTNALLIARDEVEREGVNVHFARIKLLAGRFGEARGHLDNLTNAMYADLKKRLTRNLEARENEARQRKPEGPE